MQTKLLIQSEKFFAPTDDISSCVMYSVFALVAAGNILSAALSAIDFRDQIKRSRKIGRAATAASEAKQQRPK